MNDLEKYSGHSDADLLGEVQQDSRQVRENPAFYALLERVKKTLENICGDREHSVPEGISTQSFKEMVTDDVERRLAATVKRFEYRGQASLQKYVRKMSDSAWIDSYRKGTFKTGQKDEFGKMLRVSRWVTPPGGDAGNETEIDFEDYTAIVPKEVLVDTTLQEVEARERERKGQELLDDFLARLMKCGVTEKQARIYIQKRFGDESMESIARGFGKSVRMVHRYLTKEEESRIDWILDEFRKE